jgi:AcrR family transcriptional regulator
VRPSNRTLILQAAAAVVQREGVTSVTFDSIAEEAGLTKGGLLYHFANRDALLQAVHEHLAAQWEADLHEAAGAAPEHLSARQRLAAYIQVATHSATRAELLFMLEGATVPGYLAPWDTVIERWTPPLPAPDADEDALLAAVAQLAADGLWLYEALTNAPLDPQLRQRLSDRIAALALGPTADDGPTADTGAGSDSSAAAAGQSTTATPTQTPMPTQVNPT